MLRKLAKKYRVYLTAKNIIVVGGTFYLGLILAYTVQFYWPRTINFSYSGVNCSKSPVLLPNSVGKHASPGFDVELSKSVSIAGYPIYSHYICVTPTQPPSETVAETVKISHPGSGFLKKSIKIAPRPVPALTNLDVFDQPLAAKSPVIIKLQSADNVYDYRLAANGKQTACSKDGAVLVCDIASLELAQATKYDLVLQRHFQAEMVADVFQKPITTLEPVRVIASTIDPGQSVYNVPTEVTLTLDKPVGSFDGAKILHETGESRQELPTEAVVGEKTITLRFKEPLPRSASLILELGNVVAPDGSHLAEPLSLPFQTSGGPKVVGTSIGSYKVAVDGSITLTFDSAIAAAQSINQFISLETAAGPAAITVTKKANTVTVKPRTALPRCTSFTVKVLDGIQNEFGIAGGSAWQFKSRTICQTVFSIGTSAQGRSIIGYSFGSGPSKIIYLGTLHGNEKSAAYLLNSWVNTLEANADRIPAGRTIIVIPNTNPDGYAANLRTNAHNVDLNRNFGSNDWKSGVTMPDGSYLPQGGGSTPLSEPESRAVANYVSAQKPRLLLTYHASGAIVSPNDAADSQAIATVYAQKSTVGYLSSSATGSFFKYDTTGALESWLHDKLGIPALLIELTTKTGNEFSGHQDALWYTVGL